MKEKGIRFVPAREIDRLGVESIVALARQTMEGVGNVYVSLDIDLTRGLAQQLPVRAMDIVEIAPPLDPSGITLFLALQIVFETFAVLAEKRTPYR